ncbi:MAG: YbaB/EbfC family nucleoid-associated protein [Chloroflexi bacterium]|nr:YbaB/EbfC family nucleoid-associated protein [Chloroflexota bacterium]
MPNQREMMRQLQQMQNKLAQAQAELADAQVEGSAGGGAVRVVMTGKQEVRGVSIDPSVVDPEDVEMLQDLVLAAFNDAQAQSLKLTEQRMGQVTGGLRIPGLT